MVLPLIEQSPCQARAAPLALGGFGLATAAIADRRCRRRHDGLATRRRRAGPVVLAVALELYARARRAHGAAELVDHRGAFRVRRAVPLLECVGATRLPVGVFEICR